MCQISFSRQRNAYRVRLRGSSNVQRRKAQNVALPLKLDIGGVARGYRPRSMPSDAGIAACAPRRLLPVYRGRPAISLANAGLTLSLSRVRPPSAVRPARGSSSFKEAEVPSRNTPSVQLIGEPPCGIAAWRWTVGSHSAGRHGLFFHPLCRRRSAACACTCTLSNWYSATRMSSTDSR